MKILLCTDFYNENRSPNAACTEQMRKSLTQKGYDVYILSFDLSNNSESCKPPLSSNFFYSKPRIFFKIKFSRSPFLTLPLVQFINLYLYRFLHMLYLPFFPISSFLSAIRYSRCVSNIVRERKIDIVVYQFKPNECLFSSIVNRHLNCKKIFYFLDSPLGNRWSVKNIYFRVVFKWWVRKVSQVVDHMLILDNDIETLSYMQQDKSDSKILGVGLPLISVKQPMTLRGRPPVKESYSIVYAGSIGVDRDPMDFLDSLKRLQRPEYEVYFYSNSAQFIENKYEFVSVKKDLSQEYIDKSIAKSSILLSVSTIGSSMIPSKIFYYINQGLPIIHLSLDTHDSAIKFLKEYPHGFIIKLYTLNDNELDSELRKILNEIQNLPRVDAWDLDKSILHKYTSSFVTDSIVNTISE
jgi:hypothetical protein